MKIILLALPDSVSNEIITENFVEMAKNLNQNISIKIIGSSELFPKESIDFKDALENLATCCDVPKNCNDLNFISNFWMNIHKNEKGFSPVLLKYIAKNAHNHESLLAQNKKYQILVTLCKTCVKEEM